MPSPWTSVTAPGAADLIAIHGGSPATTLQFEGSIRRLEVIETFGDASVPAASVALFGEALVTDGITLWLEGLFPTDPSGVPISEDRATILATWNTLRAKLRSTSFEFFLHYQPGTSPLYRKYFSVTTVLIRTKWNDPLGLPFQFAAITTNHTLAATAAGESE